MKFGTVPVELSEGAIVAHAIKRDGLVLKKGERISAQDIARLQAADIADVVVAHLDEDDVGEDVAALMLAQALAGEHIRVETPFTGRSNLFAKADGLLTLEPKVIDRVNALDDRVTIATLPRYRAVVAGEMVATVKIIPFAIPEKLVNKALHILGDVQIAIAPFQPLRIGVISTLLPGLKTSVVDKTLRVLAERLRIAQAEIVAEVRVPHETEALSSAMQVMAPAVDLVIVFGASAITDRRDVIPAALEASGGCIEQLGMPVDPGNLLLFGTLADGIPILGAPGCARSPVENGFDWVLQRLLAGLTVSAADIRAMGVGGLLMEIISRPQPREGGSLPKDANSKDVKSNV